MGQVLIRNLDEAVIIRLKEDARKKGVSLEQYLRDLLTEKVQPSKTDLFAEIDRALEGSQYIMTVPPEDLIREDRDKH